MVASSMCILADEEFKPGSLDNQLFKELNTRASKVLGRDRKSNSIEISPLVMSQSCVLMMKIGKTAYRP
mgnify:CR=1 FL=1